jgi:hypothetical protein
MLRVGDAPVCAVSRIAAKRAREWGGDRGVVLAPAQAREHRFADAESKPAMLPAGNRSPRPARADRDARQGGAGAGAADGARAGRFEAWACAAATARAGPSWRASIPALKQLAKHGPGFSAPAEVA